MNLEISLEDLLKNGSHFGHNKKRWNPKMEKFIYGEKNGTHILDLRKSLPLIENALKFALECSKNKKNSSSNERRQGILNSPLVHEGSFFSFFFFSSIFPHFSIFIFFSCVVGVARLQHRSPG